VANIDGQEGVGEAQICCYIDTLRGIK